MHAGAMLRDAREAAWLSLDTVSAQLKLAPRQVKALEDGEFNLLPGRTFVRGFARNYARLVHLDPETVLQALGAPTVGGLEAPPLHATTGRIGELPSTLRPRPAWLRWSVPAVIVVVLLATGAYEYLREGRKAPSPTPAPAPRASDVAPSSVTSATTSLPNPVVATPLDSGASADAPVAATPRAANTPAGTASTPGDGTAIAPIGLALRGSSWVEVRDSTGQTVLSQTVNAGQTPSIVGTPPFDVVIGNARDVTLTFRGRVIDLAPHTRGNVARLTLQ
jgi:cytoskeleton protein RodZ